MDGSISEICKRKSLIENLPEAEYVRGGEEELWERGHVVVGDGVLALGVLLRLVDRVGVDGVPAGNGRINVVVVIKDNLKVVRTTH